MRPSPETTSLPPSLFEECVHFSCTEAPHPHQVTQHLCGSLATRQLKRGEKKVSFSVFISVLIDMCRHKHRRGCAYTHWHAWVHTRIQDCDLWFFPCAFQKLNRLDTQRDVCDRLKRSMSEWVSGWVGEWVSHLTRYSNSQGAMERKSKMSVDCK